MAKEWTFKVFISEGRVNEFRKWQNTLSPKVCAKIDKIITYLEITKKWKRQYFAKLSGYTDLYEIRVVFNNVQYRLFGCFRPKEREFIILVGAIKKNGNYKPSDALNTANKRRKLIDKEGCIDEYEC